MHARTQTHMQNTCTRSQNKRAHTTNTYMYTRPFVCSHNKQNLVTQTRQQRSKIYNVQTTHGEVTVLAVLRKGLRRSRALATHTDTRFRLTLTSPRFVQRAAKSYDNLLFRSIQPHLDPPQSGNCASGETSSTIEIPGEAIRHPPGKILCRWR